MAHSRLRSLIVDARVYLWQLQLGYHQRTDAAGPWLCHDVFSAALVANPGPKLHIQLLSATQLERLRLLPTHLAIVPAPASAGPSLKITANLARQVIRLGRREGWCPERGGLPVTIAEGLDLLAEAGLVGCPAAP
jgi:hypothetical protein